MLLVCDIMLYYGIHAVSCYIMLYCVLLFFAKRNPEASAAVGSEPGPL